MLFSLYKYLVSCGIFCRFPDAISNLSPKKLLCNIPVCATNQRHYIGDCGGKSEMCSCTGSSCGDSFMCGSSPSSSLLSLLFFAFPSSLFFSDTRCLFCHLQHGIIKKFKAKRQDGREKHKLPLFSRDSVSLKW